MQEDGAIKLNKDSQLEHFKKIVEIIYTIILKDSEHTVVIFCELCSNIIGCKLQFSL